MAILTLSKNSTEIDVPEILITCKRHLTQREIAVLIENGNINSDLSWQNIYVDDRDLYFDVNLIHNCEFKGYIVIGRMIKSTLRFHDLELDVGLYNSFLEDVIIDDDVVIRNVRYIKNYRIANRVILFNIQEMSCTKHSKFGNGILKEGESEEKRIWIGVGNENDNRAVLPFEDMIAADAYIWSRYREDKALLKRFVEITEFGSSKLLNTYGYVAEDAVIKNTTLLKDAKIGSNAYIKGAFKLKNITVLSSSDEPSQIGEGVELVNGIMGYGSRVFYQAVAVRFVIGRNCQLKYGARLLNSVLGDNSTVSCCEILNNLIFPFHEQHHNSSFLIASTLMGQSNIASGATIGSNHNSRSPDGEMIAGRGFWPGLCSDFKHNCKFASFALIAKGSYPYELNIAYPFALVATNGSDKPVSIIPAYWFMYNMFAIARNKTKFIKRDKRVQKIQHIETNPLAPDSIQEVENAIKRIIDLTAEHFIEEGDVRFIEAKGPAAVHKMAKDYLHQNPKSNIVLFDKCSQKKYGANIYKGVKAYKEYRKIIKYFAVDVLIDYCKARHISKLSQAELVRIKEMPLYTKWINVGGQIIPEKKVFELFDLIKDGSIDSWDQVHLFYDKCDENYLAYKSTYAVYLLESLYDKKIIDFTNEIYADIVKDVTVVSNDMYESTLISRMKDFDDEFRMITFRNAREMDAVIGNITDTEFLYEMKESTKEFNYKLKGLFSALC